MLNDEKSESIKDFPTNTGYKFTFGFQNPKTANVAMNVAKEKGYAYEQGRGTGFDDYSNVSIWVKEPQDAIRFAAIFLIMYALTMVVTLKLRH